MAFISAFGTGFAGRMRGLATSLIPIPLALAMMAALIGATEPARLDISFAGMRSTRGNLLICLTRDAAHFPDCSSDPQARKLTIAATVHAAHFLDLTPGTYALSLIHDENGNGRLDTRFGIPREGVGFSRNPRLLVGAPSFAAVRFDIAGITSETIRLKYFL